MLNQLLAQTVLALLIWPEALILFFSPRPHRDYFHHSSQHMTHRLPNTRILPQPIALANQWS